MNEKNLRDRAIKLFHEHFHRMPHGLSRAPGRVNLIGEHTDYNDGFVLPIAINRAVWVAFTPRTDRRVLLIAGNYQNQTAEFLLDDYSAAGGALRSQFAQWSNYPRGVAWALQRRGITLHGLDGVIYGDVPSGAGLSSSAAIELAVAMAFQGVSDFDLSPKDMALTCQDAENNFVGNRCGIMDQFISALGRAGHALLIDCRDLSYKSVPLPQGVRIVICNSMKQRGLVDSEYNTRRSECEAGAAIVRLRRPEVKALRDVTLADLDAAKSEMPDSMYRRCRHVVTENLRVEKTVQALQKGDLATVGLFMEESHESLRKDFEVSCKELDELVAIAKDAPGCVGARLTGAGFGGCTVNLVRAENVEAFCNFVRRGYEAATGRKADIYTCEAEDGARLELIA